MTSVSITKLRPNLKELADKVCFYGERVIVEGNGRPSFVLINIEDYKALEIVENEIDIESAKKALKEKGSIKHKDLKRKLRL